MAASLREWSQFRFMVSRFFLLSPPLSRRKVNLLDRGEFCGEKDSSPKPPLLAVLTQTMSWPAAPASAARSHHWRH